MISSYKDYKFYLQSDRKALYLRPSITFIEKVKDFFYPNPIWVFQSLLRKYEYLKNKRKKSFLDKIRLLLVYKKYIELSKRLGFSIPPNVFGPGLSIAHYGTIVVNRNARIGANCRIHICVNIGASGGDTKAPQLGNNIYIGPGAKIFGDISIPDNTIIGANAVVNKSFTEKCTILAGIPCKIVKKLSLEEIEKYIPHSCQGEL